MTTPQEPDGRYLTTFGDHNELAALTVRAETAEALLREVAALKVWRRGLTSERQQTWGGSCRFDTPTERTPEMNDRDRVTRVYEPPLDAGIRRAVEVLGEAGIETFESCEGGAGHSYPYPAVRFHGQRSEGFRALAVALQSGLPVAELHRVWRMEDGEPAGPWWELVFTDPES